MTVAYTGNSAYCYSHSLHMMLRAVGMPNLPEPGFLECLTTMAFGKLYVKTPDEPMFFPGGARYNPDSGLDLALRHLGWTSDQWHGGPPEEAIDRLREALRRGPALLGPLDMGYLSYAPGSAGRLGADHFVVALALTEREVVLHDPRGYPFAHLPLADLLQAWQAESIPYGRKPYMFRWNYRAVEPARTRAEMIAQALPAIKEQLTFNPGGPMLYAGPQALHLLARTARTDMPPALAGALVEFGLPLGARRSVDAAVFLHEAGLDSMATNVERQARLFGEMQYHATHEDWSALAARLDLLAEVEATLDEHLFLPVAG